jgi:ubiquinone/menaquinone biosynthesis C-methylase UbiE
MLAWRHRHAWPADDDGPPAAEGIIRSVRLFRLFLKEQTEPELFYTGLARDAVDQVARHCELNGRVVLDVGGGAGEFTAAFRSRGAHCYLFEPDRSEMLSRGERPAGAVLADGYWLPVSDAGADVCFSSNVLEHVPDPGGLIEEMIRVTKPGGLIYLSFTNWYSPWGGHEMSPWHYLGAGFAERRYRKRLGKEPKHHVGANLYRHHVGPMLRMLKARADIQVVEALPRYYPRWCRALLVVPLLREVATWNLLVVFRRLSP